MSHVISQRELFISAGLHTVLIAGALLTLRYVQPISTQSPLHSIDIAFSAHPTASVIRVMDLELRQALPPRPTQQQQNTTSTDVQQLDSLSTMFGRVLAPSGNARARSNMRAQIPEQTSPAPAVAVNATTTSRRSSSGMAPFFDWVPPALASRFSVEPRAAVTPRESGMRVLAETQQLTNAAATNGQANSDIASIVGLARFPGEQWVTDENGTLNSHNHGQQFQSHVNHAITRHLEDNSAPQIIAGSGRYYAQLRRALRRVWQPAPVPPPSLAQGVVNTFFTTPEQAIAATQISLGPRATGRSFSAAEDVELAHPNSPSIPLRNTMTARAEATAIRYQVLVEVDQDQTGQVTATRIIESSRRSDFDHSALVAVRQAASETTPPEMTGGWRSRWRFEVQMSRDPVISALPSLGDSPALGITAEIAIDPETGQPEPHLPLMVHRRVRVRLVSARVISPPQPTSTQTQTPAQSQPAPQPAPQPATPTRSPEQGESF